jgi:1,4-alpha-glucan branching enzyme
VDKADPFAVYYEGPPRTASIVWDLDYAWEDGEWLARRRQRNALDQPMSAYEMHLGSWRRVPEEDNRYLTYRELAPLLAEYLVQMGFTHVSSAVMTPHGSGHRPRVLRPTNRWVPRLHVSHRLSAPARHRSS